MLSKLIKLANQLDKILAIKEADYIDGLVVLAAKVDTLKLKHPHLIDKIDRLHLEDPTPQKKYLDWGVKMLAENSIENVIRAIKLFHNNYQRLPNKDINHYTTTDAIEAAVNALPEKSKRQEKKDIKQTGSDTIYTSDNFVVIHPKTKAAVCQYGAGSKWCITEKDKTYFEEYSSRGISFYIIISKDRLLEGTEQAKVAVAMNEDGTYEVYDAHDNTISEQELIDYCKSEFTNIINAIKQHAKVEGIKTSEQVVLDIIYNGSINNRIRLLEEQPKINVRFLNDMFNAAVKHKEQDTLFPLIAAHEEVSEEILNKIVDTNSRGRHRNVDAIMERENIPESVVLNIINKFPGYKIEFLSRNDTPEVIVRELYDKRIKPHVNALAKNPDDYTKLPEDDFYEIVPELAAKKNLPVDILKGLISLNNEKADESLAANPAIMQVDKAAEKYSNDSDYSVRRALASNPALPKELIYSLANDKDSSVREEIAKREELPEELQIKLATDNNESVRLAILRRHQDSELSPAVLNAMINNEDTYYFENMVGELIEYNKVKSFDPEMLLTFVKNILQRAKATEKETGGRGVYSPRGLGLLLSSKDLPQEYALALYGQGMVPLAIFLRNPNLSRKIFEMILAEPPPGGFSKTMIKSMLENPAFPDDLKLQFTKV